jgi:hypothetical protein
MKKVSTAATKQSRNISQQKLTIGLDLGDRDSWYCVVDEAGQIRGEQRVRTNAKALQEVFSALPRFHSKPLSMNASVPRSAGDESAGNPPSSELFWPPAQLVKANL